MTGVTLNAIGTAVDAYKALFVSGPAAGLLSRPNPVRRNGFDRRLRIERIDRVAVDAVGLILSDGDILPAWRPGAHIDVVLPSGRQRQYSLCGDPANRFTYRIAVRRIPDGSASVEIHDDLRVGDRIAIRGPRNAFTFVDAPSYFFLAGGIGITPILPMAKAAGDRGRLFYAGRSRDSMPFLDEIPAATLITGLPDVPAILRTAEPGAAVYVCGPPPMIAAAQRCMFDINPTGSLHAERFSAPPVIDGRQFSVRLARSGTTVHVGPDETALTALRRKLPNLNYSCRQGFCGTCKVRSTAGADVLICVARPSGDELVLDL